MATYTRSFSKSATKYNTITFPVNGITLEIQSQNYIDGSWPVHCGVPIPLGSVQNTSTLGLFEDGVRIPVQITTVDTWLGTNSYPKWIHLNFNAIWSGGVPRTYVLKTVATAGPSTNLSYVDNGTTIICDNGYIKFQINKTAFAGIEKVWFDRNGVGSYASPLVNDTTGGPYFIDQGDIKYRSIYNTTNTYAGNATTTTVVRSGVNKITLKVQGTLVTADPTASSKMMDFTCFISLYAGSPAIHIRNFNTLRNLRIGRSVRDIGFSVKLPNCTAYGYGLDGAAYTGSLVSSNPFPTPPNTTLAKVLAHWSFESIDTTSPERPCYPDSVHNNKMLLYNYNQPDNTHFVATGYNGNGHGIAFTYPSSGIAYSANSPIAAFNTMGSFTISFWIKVTQLDIANANGEYYYILNKWIQNGPVGQQLTVEMNRLGTLSFYVVATNQAYGCSASSPLSLNTWYHVFLEYNQGTGIKIYINNSVAGSQNFSTNLMYHAGDENTPIALGDLNFNSSRGFGGVLDELTIFQGVLDNGEKSTIYNSYLSNITYPWGLPVNSESIADRVWVHQEKYNSARVIGSDTNSGQQADGWFSVTNVATKISLLTKKFWQHHPNEVEMGQTGITWHSWPYNGRSIYSDSELTSKYDIMKFLNLHHGKYFEYITPQFITDELIRGPGYTATVNTSTGVWTTSDRHEIEEMYRNVTPITFGTTGSLPTSSPQINTSTTYYANPYIQGALNTTQLLIYANIDDAYNSTNHITFSNTGSGVHTIYSGLYTTIGENSEVSPGVLGTSSLMNALNLTSQSFEQNFCLYFSSTAAPINDASFRNLFELEPLAFAPADWTCNSKVYGNLAAVDKVNFPDIENALENDIQSFCNINRTLAYGRFNYGDTVETWYPQFNRGSLHRHWNTSHYFGLEDAWIRVFRGVHTPEMLDLVRRWTAHYTNIDTEKTPSGLSGWHHAGKGYVHWGDSSSIWGHYGDPNCSFFAWFLDQDDWANDTLDAYMKSPWVYTYVSLYDDLHPGNPGYLLTTDPAYTATYQGTRDYTAGISKAILLYEYSKDPRLLPAINYLTESQFCNFPISIQGNFGLWDPLWINKYCELTRSPTYLSPTGYVMNNVTNAIGTCFADGLLALAYEISNDPTYITKYAQAATDLPLKLHKEPGSIYDNYGLSTGYTGEMICRTWGFTLKKLKDLGINAPPARQFFGSYFLADSRSALIEGRATNVYFVKPLNQANQDILVTLNGSSQFAITVIAPNGTYSSLKFSDDNYTQTYTTPPRSNITLQNVGTLKTDNADGTYSYLLYMKILADGQSGLYQIIVSGAGYITQPYTTLPEASTIKSNLLQSWPESLLMPYYKNIGYMMPLVSYPLTLTFNNINVLTQVLPSHIKITDNNGSVFVDTSTMYSRPGHDSVTVTMNNNDGHPTPWYVEAAYPGSGIGATLTVTPTNGQAADEVLLFSNNKNDLQTIFNLKQPTYNGISNVEYWFDFTDTSTLYSDVNLTTSAIANGAVGGTKDKSGNQYVMIQADGTKQPIRKDSIVNGLSVLRFDGVNDTLSARKPLPLYPQEAIYMVVRSNTTVSNRRLIFNIGNTTTSVPSHWIYFDASHGLALRSWDTVTANDTFPSISQTSKVNSGQWFIIGGLFDHSGSQTIRVNGVPTSSGASQGSTRTTYDMLISGAIDALPNMDVAEIIAFNRNLTNSEITTIESALSTKYGITLG